MSGAVEAPSTAGLIACKPCGTGVKTMAFSSGWHVMQIVQIDGTDQLAWMEHDVVTCAVARKARRLAVQA